MQENPFKTIGKNENPFWIRGEFMGINDDISAKNFIGKEVSLNNYIDQTSERNFQEFANPQITYGFDINRIQRCACGISAVYMVLRTLNFEYSMLDQTVGELALWGMSLHRNDLMENGELIKVGTPVLRNPSGWYHDALIYIGKQNGLNGLRYENVTLESLSGKMASLQSENCSPLAIVSVKDTYFSGNSPNTSHLVIVNGFEIQNDKVSKIRVVDSKPKKERILINEWIDVTSWIRECYSGKAMIFFKSKQ